MSIGDALRLLRARSGGVTPAEIETALPDLPRGLYRQMEQRYRALGDDESIRLLADYYGVPFEELRPQRDWPRKALSYALLSAEQNGVPIELQLRTGQSVKGTIEWWDLGAIALQTDEGELVVQRHAVTEWDPRAPEEPAEPFADTD